MYNNNYNYKKTNLPLLHFFTHSIIQYLEEQLCNMTCRSAYEYVYRYTVYWYNLYKNLLPNIHASPGNLAVNNRPSSTICVRL